MLEYPYREPGSNRSGVRTASATNSESGAWPLGGPDFRQLVGQARDMCEQLPNRDPVPVHAGELGEELPDRIVEPELALIIQRHQGRHGHRLRDRAQHKESIHRSGRAEGSGEHATFVSDIEDRAGTCPPATAPAKASAAASSLSPAAAAAIIRVAQGPSHN